MTPLSPTLVLFNKGALAYLTDEQIIDVVSLPSSILVSMMPFNRLDDFMLTNICKGYLQGMV